MVNFEVKPCYKLLTLTKLKEEALSVCAKQGADQAVSNYQTIEEQPQMLLWNTQGFY